MMRRKKTKIAVGLSGGVDSSVAAALLKEDGNEVIGITMEIYDGAFGAKEAGKHACYGPGELEDIAAAECVCKKLDIPFHVIDLKSEYQFHVIDYFKEEYLSGRTPNPCIICNRRLKFGFLVQKARQIGIDFEYFATGHYANIESVNGRYVLKKAKDKQKDQTYFLYTLTPDHLSRIKFPLGIYKKEKTREMARYLGLETADRIESQDFIAGGNYSALFSPKDVKPGDIVDKKGTVIGQHRGIIHYTLGQRQGLGIPAGHPLYVIKIDARTNRIVAGDRNELYKNGLIASQVNLIAVDTIDRPYRVNAKIRLNHTPVAATVFPLENDRIKLIFDQPEMAITPGQSVVMYTKDLVLGGGVIEEAIE